MLSQGLRCMGRGRSFPRIAARGVASGSLTPSDISHFRGLLGPGGVLEGAADCESYNVDWMRKYRGRASAVLRPKSTREVSAILAYCHSRRLAVVPQGGNTGLVGGSVPIADELVLSLRGLDRVRSFDTDSGALVADAGCVLESLDSFVRTHGHCMPLDLGAKGSCTIGGNVSTNAGGLRFLRYGSLHGSVLGLEVVRADGTVLDLLTTLRKDNVGYDLKQLFIGSEGTLGVVTGVAIHTPRAPRATHVALLACDSFRSVQAVLARARDRLGEILSAAEFFDAASADTVFESPRFRKHDPLDERFPFYVLVETAGSSREHDAAKVEDFLQGALASGVAISGVVAQSESQAGELWAIRENITTTLGERGLTHKYDISLAPQDMYRAVLAARERVASALGEPVDAGSAVSALEPPTGQKPTAPASNPDRVRVVGYGHLGDGNLHLNVSIPRGSKWLDPARAIQGHDPVLHAIEPWLFQWVVERRGSISAEHGLGQSKNKFLDLAKPPAATALMRELKQWMDPHGILNPGKVV